MRVEPVVDEWTGPGEKDGTIVPIGYEENAVHPEASKSKYYGEWWYFDARLDDGHVVVGFLQASELMTRKPGIELHVYKPSGEKLSVVKKFDQSALKASKERCDVEIGRNGCRVEIPPDGGLPKHYLHIAEEGMEADLTFHSLLPGWKPGKGMTHYGGRGYFSWVVPIPRASVEGSVRFEGKTREVKGIGYHDHNVVTPDMRRILSFWYWGRLYTDDFTLLYAYVRTKKRFANAVSRPLMLAYKDEIILSTGEMRLRDSDFRFSKVANREYPARLEIEVPGQLSLRFDVRKLIDQADFITEMGINPVIMNPAVKWAINRFMRPGWFRFESDFELKVEHQGRSFVEKGTTLHEMVALQ
jgi:hypothetical protein